LNLSVSLIIIISCSIVIGLVGLVLIKLKFNYYEVKTIRQKLKELENTLSYFESYGKNKKGINALNLVCPFKIPPKLEFFYSEAGQDLFVMSVLGGKRNGYFVEIGSQHPIFINNTYLLENHFGWKGCMVEKDEKWKPMYNAHRTATYKIEDATEINYKDWFKECQMPNTIDYLSLDLDVSNNSTINSLKKIPLKHYQFRVITFEHDIYHSESNFTRNKSRQIFTNLGYVLVCPDVKNQGLPYEDWYVHPDLVDMNMVNRIKTDHSLEWSEILWEKMKKID